MCIDLRDIISYKTMKGQNIDEHNVDIELKKRYIYDHYLQLNLSLTDGAQYKMGLFYEEFRVKHKKTREAPILQDDVSAQVSVYLKFSHRDE